MSKKKRISFYNLALDGEVDLIRQRLLIEQPAPQLDEMKRTPLMGAAMNLRLDAVRLLAPYSNPFHLDAFGHSFWHFCARAPELMKVALECFDPKACPDTIPAPLIQCVGSPDHPNLNEVLESVRLLIPRSDPNVAWKGKTALEFMAIAQNWKMAEELAPFCARDHALVVFSFAGGSNMPRFHALLEAEALAEVLSIREPADASARIMAEAMKTDAASDPASEGVSENGAAIATPAKKRSSLDSLRL